MGDNEGPTGLAKSLDELIAEQRHQRKNTKKERKRPGSKPGVSKRSHNGGQNNNRDHRGSRDNRMVTDKVFRIRGSGGQKHRGNGRIGHSRRHDQYRNRSPDTRRRDDYRPRSRGRGDRGDGSFGRRGRGRGRGQPFMNFGHAYYGMYDGQGAQYDQPEGEQIPEEILNRIKYSWNSQGVLGIGFDGQDVAQISPSGDVYIRLPVSQTGGDTASIIDAINRIFSPINVKIIVKDLMKNDFQISDGSSLVRYHEGLVVHGKGQIGRASLVMHHIDSQNQAGTTMKMQS
jgi:hypothetical protein